MQANTGANVTRFCNPGTCALPAGWRDGVGATHLSQEQRGAIARTLFKVEIVDGDWLNGLCPFHEDQTPSFGYNVKDDVFKCLALCTDSGDLVDLFCRVKGFTHTIERRVPGVQVGVCADSRPTRNPTEDARANRRRSAAGAVSKPEEKPAGAPVS